MLKFFRALLPAAAEQTKADGPAAIMPAPPDSISLPGGETFPVASHLTFVDGLPTPDWNAVNAWAGQHAAPHDQAAAWAAGERAWLAHLRAALGGAFYVTERGDALLLSSLEPNLANATLDFMNKTQQRILRVLDGVAQVAQSGSDILIVFDGDDRYYSYVSRYYADAGEFAFSSGMYINHGCGHFVTKQADLLTIQPVIAHEMTHSCLAHLPIPAWLNEGIAVNTEQRLCPSPQGLFTPHQMHEKHLRFWGEEEIQQFWSGQSFLRGDEGNLLSYDLARIMVDQFSSDWDTFRHFVLAANLADGGAAAAQECLGVELGSVATALLEREYAEPWSPDPARWSEAPERGAF